MSEGPKSPDRTVPLTRPSFDEREEELILAVLRSGWVTQGPRVVEFEQAFAKTIGATDAVAVSSCTTALFLALHALGIGRGDEVIVPSLSFIASANSVVHCGATPVFVDVDPATYNLDPELLDQAIGPRTRAVMVVHQLGFPAELDPIRTLARERGLEIVEDAACALGSEYRGDPIGRSGRAVCFSFHPRKVLVTGEGGMIATDSTELAARLRLLRHQGMSISDLERHRSSTVLIESYPEVGYNFRLSDLHAALGLAQLEKLDGFLRRRRAAAARYDEALASIEELETPAPNPRSRANYQSYIIRLKGAGTARRNQLLEELSVRGVASRRGLMATHAEPCHASFPQRGSLQHTEEAAAETFLLPMYADLAESDQNYVIEQLKHSLDALRSASPGPRSEGAPS